MYGLYFSTLSKSYWRLHLFLSYALVYILAIKDQIYLIILQNLFSIFSNLDIIEQKLNKKLLSGNVISTT